LPNRGQKQFLIILLTLISIPLQFKPLCAERIEQQNQMTLLSSCLCECGCSSEKQLY